MIQWHIGCSTYNNKLWKGIFYPHDLPASKWFEHYCSHFNTYEINSTFYNFPRVNTLKKWFDKTPQDFLFSVKAPKLITHIKKIENCETEVNDFFNVVTNGLQEKLGAVLFQFPPSFTYTPERLETVVKLLSSKTRTAVEFRNLSWWNLRVSNALQENNIIFCSVNYPKLPDEIVPTFPDLYVRLHGNPRLFYSEYDLPALQDVYNGIEKLDTVQHAFVYFNNTAGTGGIINALTFKAMEVCEVHAT